MPRSRQTPRLHRQGGAVNWVTLGMLAGVAAAAYLAWVWVPVYVENYEVKQVVRQFANEAVKNRDDAQLVQRMVDRIRRVRQVESMGPDGRPARRPSIDLDVKDVTWERVEPASLRVAFAYQREVVYPFLDRRDERVLTVDLTLDVSAPDWGPPR